MPVETAEEQRMQRTGSLRIAVGGEHVVELVGVFAFDMAKRGRSEAGRQFGGEALHGATLASGVAAV